MLFEEQVISKDKCMRIFSCKIENIVCIIFQIFCNVGERTKTLLFTAGEVLFGVFSATAL